MVWRRLRVCLEGSRQLVGKAEDTFDLDSDFCFLLYSNSTLFIEALPAKLRLEAPGDTR